MGRVWIAWTFVLFFAATSAEAQPLPDSVRTAGVTQTQWDAIRREAQGQARRAGISEAALVSAVEASGINFARSEGVSAASLQRMIFDAMEQQSTQVAELQRRLERLSADPDASAAALFSQARTALDSGRLDEADRMLAQIAEQDLATIQEADAEAARRRLRAGETIASRGQVAFVQADYVTAAAHLARAAEIVPQTALSERWQYRLWQGEALAAHGQRFDAGSLAEAVHIFENVALPLAPRNSRPADWVTTQNNLGAALVLLGERGDNSALVRAVAAFEAALSAQRRDRDPERWAVTQMNLASALSIIGERGNEAALSRSVTAYEAALTVRTRQRDPDGWARINHNIGITFFLLGANGDAAMLERAIAAYEAALTVRTRERDAQGWADTQVQLGAALRLLGQRGNNAAFTRSLAAYEAALTVLTREQDPQGWAMAQNNLGSVLLSLGERGDGAALVRSVAAYEAALTVLTRERHLQGWTQAQFNLALARRAQARQGNSRALPAALSAARNALAGYEQMAQIAGATMTRRLIADLEARR